MSQCTMDCIVQKQNRKKKSWLRCNACFVVVHANMQNAGALFCYEGSKISQTVGENRRGETPTPSTKSSGNAGRRGGGKTATMKSPLRQINPRHKHIWQRRQRRRYIHVLDEQVHMEREKKCLCHPEKGAGTSERVVFPSLQPGFLNNGPELITV